MVYSVANKVAPFASELFQSTLKEKFALMKSETRELNFDGKEKKRGGGRREWRE